MQNQTFRIEMELESSLDETRLRQYFEDNFDMAFLKINLIKVEKK